MKHIILFVGLAWLLVACGGTQSKVQVTYYDGPVTLHTDRPTAVAAIEDESDIILIIGQTTTEYGIADLEGTILYSGNTRADLSGGKWFSYTQQDGSKIYFLLGSDSAGIVNVTLSFEVPTQPVQDLQSA